MATMTVTTRFQNLNIRKGPSIQTPIVGNAARGSTVEVDTGRSQSSGGWVWLGYGSNKWICQKDPRYNYVFLTPKTEEAKTEPAKQEPPKQEPPKPAVDYDAIANALAATDAIPEPRISGIDGSAVMYSDQKYDAYQDSFIDLNEGWQMRKYQGMMTKTELEELDKKSSKYVQNDKGFPILAEFNKNGYYDYSWYMDYEKDGFLSDMPRLRHQLNYGVEDSNELMRTYTTHYNRFKLPMVGDALRSRFSHVFFVRPDLNILERGGSGFVLPEHIKDDPNYVYSYNHDIEMMRELVSDAGYDHDFSMYLSNRAYSFQLKDEGIDNGTYGEACTGYKIAFGRHNIASKTAGEFEITYKDDREYHIYRLHKLWVDYISGVYQGSFVPKEKYIKEKMIDYATAVYYIQTAEDGETVIFWSKYYGVFPVSMPSSGMGWAGGMDDVKNEATISYQYSFKEDFNPLSLVEFNMNSEQGNYTYVPTFNVNTYSPTSTWVGAPFIETFNNSTLTPYTFKLRFRPKQLTTTGTVKSSHNWSESSRERAKNDYTKSKAVSNKKSTAKTAHKKQSLLSKLTGKGKKKKK